MMDLYTKIPKWVMVGLIRGNLKLHEVQVLAYVLEKTVAFNEDFAQITPKRIAEATGLGNHVYSALKSLIAQGVLIESNEGIGPAKGLQNLDSKIWSNSLQNLEKKTPKSGVRKTHKSTVGAGSGNPKKTSKETHKKSPLTPLSESGLVSGWVKEIFGVENPEEASKLSERSKDDLKRFLSHPVAAQERAVKVFRSWPATITSPLGFIFRVLKDPSSFPVPFEAPEKPKRVNPYEAYPWGHYWDPMKRGTSSEDDWFIGLARRCQDFGTGSWREAWDIYQAEGTVTGMEYVWKHLQQPKEA